MTPLPNGYLARPFAHRGLHGAGRPENALSAVRAAVAAGWSVELDVQQTADGQAVMFHDYTLDRMTEVAGRVRDHTAKDLSRIPLRESAEGIPTLAETLAVIGGKVPVVVEIKDQDGALGPDIGTLEAAVARDLAVYDGPAAVMSFNPFSVIEMARLAPDLPRGLVTDPFGPDHWAEVPEARRAEHRRMSRLEEAGAAFISHRADDLASAAVAEARARGLGILCWTIRTPDQARQALQLADAITFEGFTPA